MQVGVAPGTVSMIVNGGGAYTGLKGLKGCAPCPPDPIVTFITDPFVPGGSAAGAIAAGSRISYPVDPYGTDSTMKGASPFGVSWSMVLGVLGVALAGGLGIGYVTQRRRKR